MCPNHLGELALGIGCLESPWTRETRISQNPRRPEVCPTSSQPIHSFPAIPPGERRRGIEAGQIPSEFTACPLLATGLCRMRAPRGARGGLPGCTHPAALLPGTAADGAGAAHTASGAAPTASGARVHRSEGCPSHKGPCGMSVPSLLLWSCPHT